MAVVVLEDRPDSPPGAAVGDDDAVKLATAPGLEADGAAVTGPVTCPVDSAWAPACVDGEATSPPGHPADVRV